MQLAAGRRRSASCSWARGRSPGTRTANRPPGSGNRPSGSGRSPTPCAAARQKLEAALDRATAALREDHPPGASDALDRAAELLDPADAPDLRERYQDLRADLAAVAELNRVWTRASTVLHEQAPGAARRVHEVRRFDEDAAPTGYPAAFAARGLAVATADPAALADRVARSPARDRLVAGLDGLAAGRPGGRTGRGCARRAGSTRTRP